MTLTFSDFKKPIVKRLENFTDLALYLEQVPNMFGLFVNDKVTIEVQTINTNQSVLFSTPA